MENKNIKNIIRELPCDGNDFSTYFDDDYVRGEINENATLYIIYNEGYGRLYGFNIDEYKELVKTADELIQDFDYVREDGIDSYKRVMELYGIKYNPRRCHELKEWSLRANTNRIADIAEYLMIITGEKWSIKSARGYSQSDYVEILYCEAFYDAEDAEKYGEVYLGAAKEFCVIDLDENGEESWSCCGYIIADCEIKSWDKRDETYKRLVCEWAGIDEQTTQLEMIDGYHTYTTASYRIA